VFAPFHLFALVFMAALGSVVGCGKWCSAVLAILVPCALTPHGAEASLRSRTEDALAEVDRGAEGRRLYSTSTQYCYEKHSTPPGNCWQNKPGNYTPTCTPGSGTTTCLCQASAGIACSLDELTKQPPTTGRCAEVVVYVPGGEKHIQNETGFVDVTGEDPQVYCMKMVPSKMMGRLSQAAAGGDAGIHTHGVMASARVAIVSWARVVGTDGPIGSMALPAFAKVVRQATASTALHATILCACPMPWPRSAMSVLVRGSDGMLLSRALLQTTGVAGTRVSSPRAT